MLGGSEADRSRLRWLGGPLATLAVAGLLEVLTGEALLGANVAWSLAALALLASVAGAALLGGVVPGLAATTIAVAYLAYFLSAPGWPFRYAPDGRRRLLIVGLVLPILAFIVGSLKERVDRLLDRERAARRRSAFLADASAALAASLDYEKTLAHVTKLAVPELADWCSVHLVTEDGAVHQAAPTPADSAGTDVAGYLPERSPLDAAVPAGPAEVLRTGRPVLIPDASDGAPADASNGQEHLALGRDLGVVSYLAVPLVARGRALGVLSFGVAAPARRYGPEDLALAEELARRAAVAIDNARLYREAQEAIRDRDRFLSVAAHELRTPVTVIKGLAQLLARPPGGGPAAGARSTRALGQIEDAAGRLAVLTQDLLDVSSLRLGHLPFRPRPLDLAALVSEVRARFGDLLDGRHPLVVDLPGAPVPVDADPDRLEQVLSNLLDNAAKYSPEGGEIGLTLRVDGGGALLAVRDQGIGLPAGVAEAIFAPFGRAANAEERRLPGLGLGLHLCRGIVERHGGRIWAESDGEGCGSIFQVWVPLVPPVAAPPEDADAAPPPAQGRFPARDS
ncbi:MAG: GAF domain-containing sensor histidine kinase [Chloroflexota bacterium]|nr:GAF domain-containing sensor histidine kinase [Chloroflexota bacterium]